MEVKKLKKIKRLDNKKADIHINLIQKEEVFQHHHQEVPQVEEV